MTEPIVKKPRNVFPDRFTIDATNLDKIGRIHDQLNEAVPACTATRKDIINWVIEKTPDTLSASDLKELSDRFYDEELFLKLALEEVRAAKSRGERLSLNDILQRKNQITISSRKAIRKRKSNLHSVPDEKEVSDNNTTTEPS